MNYQRPNIQRMTGYVPGEQPNETDVIKLNTNENPYPVAEPVMQVMRDVTAESLRRYPPPTALPFRKIAADIHNLTPDHIIATNGGDELLRLLLTTFVNPAEPIGTAEPSYSLYSVLAAVQDAPVVTVPLNNDWSIPSDLPRRFNEANVKLTFIVNPHAPSGSLTPVARLAELAEQLTGLLVIDEAYIDFVDDDLQHNAVPLVEQFDNVVILRSMSKGYSLAGLRLGYGLASPALIEPMMSKTKDSYNVDIVAQRIGCAALQHRDHARRTWEAVRTERTRMTNQLAALGLTCPASQSNFLLATVPPHFAGGAKTVYETLKQQRILVRYFNQDRLHDKLRITIGTPDQNNALLNALKQLA